MHGNEIIAGRVLGYDSTRKRRTSDHTWERILDAIQTVCGAQCERYLMQFAGYVVLDGLIGNTDRHHENWGFIRRDRPTRSDYQLAPSFDHASSLGREMRDEGRLRRLALDDLENGYLRKARGGIYLQERGDEPVPPIVLVEKLAPIHPRLFEPWLQRLPLVTDQSVRAILGRMPRGWITDPQADFAAEIIRVSRDVLLRIKCQ